MNQSQEKLFIVDGLKGSMVSTAEYEDESLVGAVFSYHGLCPVACIHCM